MQWFVRPEVVRLDLGGGQWIDVKRELTVKEEDAAVLAAAVGQTEGGITFDAGAWRRTRVASFLTAWSLDADVSRAAVDALTAEGFKAIQSAIQAHEHPDVGGSEGNATVPQS